MRGVNVLCLVCPFACWCVVNEQRSKQLMSAEHSGSSEFGDGAAAESMRGSRRDVHLSSESDTHPRVGTTVILHSLSARADLNGLLGTVVSPIDVASRRIAVSLPPKIMKPPIMVKPQNMSRVGEPADISTLVATEHQTEVRERLIAVSGGTSKVLDLEHTDLKLVPAAIGVLGARVEILVLAGNDQVTSLPPAIAALQSLRLLDVDGCCLSALPASLSFLSSLQSLYANGNRLTSLPVSFGQLRSLRELRLSGNALGGKDDPNAIAPIAKLPLLSVLWLARNALTSLPASVCTLGQLKELDLDGNALDKLPAALLSGMCQLEELTLEGNPLEWPPAATAKLGLAAMRTWHAAHARPEQPQPREIPYGHEPEGSMHAPSGVKGFRTNAAGGEFIFPGRSSPIGFGQGSGSSLDGRYTLGDIHP